jgi:hypothetical protein
MNDAPITLRERVISAISCGGVWDREDAIAPVDEIFDDIESALKRDVRFKHITRDEFDLLLAGVRRRAELKLGELLHNKVDVDDAIDNVVKALG